MYAPEVFRCKKLVEYFFDRKLYQTRSKKLLREHLVQKSSNLVLDLVDIGCTFLKISEVLRCKQPLEYFFDRKLILNRAAGTYFNMVRTVVLWWA